MELGVCCGPELAQVAKDAGFAYIEMSVAGLLKPLEDEGAFQTAFAAVRAAALPCRVVNCFIPGQLPITGPKADLAALRAYVTTTCKRAAEAGVDTIVFGSGGARRYPDGWDKAAGYRQLVEFGRMVAPIAAKAGVTIVVEPLNRTECNVLVTVQESADYVQTVDHPSFRLLVDGYHWGKDGDSGEAIVVNSALFRHTHIATVAHRLAPAAEPCPELTPFIDRLREAKYTGRLSIEAGLGDAPTTLPAAYQELRRLGA